MQGYNYRAMLNRIESGEPVSVFDVAALSELAGNAMIAPGGFSADAAAEMLCDGGGEFGDCGKSEGGGWYAEYKHPDFGNDYGYGPTLGRAMWAAFVALTAKIDREEEQEGYDG